MVTAVFLGLLGCLLCWMAVVMLWEVYYLVIGGAVFSISACSVAFGWQYIILEVTRGGRDG